MSEQNIEFQSVDLIIDDGTHNNNTIVSNDKSKKETEKLSASIMMANRLGEPPKLEDLQELQNRLMGRSENFSKLSNAEKEKILFEEMENWHFSKMPKIEDLQKEFKEKHVTYEVDSLDNPESLKGVGAPHINIKAESVRLAVMSDGKTITFNNKELLEQYRNNIEKKNNEVLNTTKSAQNLCSKAHDERKFE